MGPKEAQIVAGIVGGSSRLILELWSALREHKHLLSAERLEHIEALLLERLTLLAELYRTLPEMKTACRRATADRAAHHD